VIFSEAKREFDTRYYLWASSEFKREIGDGFPTLKSFKSGPAWETYQFMLKLSQSERLLLAHALLNRFHPNAVKDLNETLDSDEESLRTRRDAFPSNVLTFEDEVRARKKLGEEIKFASKAKLRKVMTAKFKTAFGAECIGLACVDEEPELAFKMKRAGWIVNTFFYFGRGQTVLNYSHNIESEQSFPYRGRQIGMGLAGMISFNSYLGIASQTEWTYITNEEVDLACSRVLNLCSHFFDLLPKLLKGLESETVTPDEGYEFSNNPFP
jgi:hypothetical protein